MGKGELAGPGTVPAEKDGMGTCGVVLERRRFLRLSVSALAAWAAGRPWEAFPGGNADPVGPGGSGKLAFEEFLARAFPEAERLVGMERPDEEGYLSRLAEWVSRTSPIPETAFKGNKRVKGAVVARKIPLVIYQFRIEPGGAIPYHDHRNYNGILLGVEGELRVRSFEIASRDGENRLPPAGATFLIRQTRDARLGPGGISTLTRTRDNIHDVRGGEKGARFLDIFTYFNDQARSRDLAVEEKPRDPVLKTYDASWR